GIFEKTAITEMKHAEAIAERLNFLGGTPTTVPTKIMIGGKPAEDDKGQYCGGDGCHKAL
ncbi:MAG: ferritin-like domain-containing protein, partial [candidate division Zixibacteria bacterium]|nr:ferritin-like domain-containing protein [candidate division Zixibacteria bacterium]